MTMISIRNDHFNIKKCYPMLQWTLLWKNGRRTSIYCTTLWWCKQKRQDTKHNNKKAGSVADWATLLQDLVDFQNLWSLKFSKMTSDKPQTKPFLVFGRMSALTSIHFSDKVTWRNKQPSPVAEHFGEQHNGPGCSCSRPATLKGE